MHYKAEANSANTCWQIATEGCGSGQRALHIPGLPARADLGHVVLHLRRVLGLREELLTWAPQPVSVSR